MVGLVKRKEHGLTQLPLFGNSAEVGAWTPADLFASGEDGGWLAISPSTCWQDTAGTTAAGVGDPVGRVDDQSGNGNHALQGTAANRPTLQQDAGGKYYLQFDGTNDHLNFTVTPGLFISGLHYCLAYDTNGDTQNIFFAVSDTNTTWAFIGDASSTSTTLIAMTTGAQPTTTLRSNRARVRPANRSVFHLGVNGKKVQVWESSGGSGDVRLPDADAGIGNYHNGVAYALSGKLYGLVWRETLTADEIANIETYLAEISGVTLDAPNGWTPADLFASGEEGFFFDMESGNLFQSSGGAAAGSGDPCGYVTDLSGNANHLQQSDAAKKFTVGVDSDGALYIQGDGSADYMETPDITLGSSVATFAAVVEETTLGTKVFAAFGDAYNDTESFYVSAINRLLVGNIGGTGYRREDPTNCDMINKKPFIVELDRAGPDIKFTVFDEVAATTVSGDNVITGDFDTTRPFTLGGYWNGSTLTFPSSAKIFSALLINRALTTLEKSYLTAYLTALKAV